MGKLVITGNSHIRQRVNVSGLVSYQQMLVNQGFTNYWSLQTQRNAAATEPDLIGSVNMTMTSGDTVNNTSGPLRAPDGSNAQTFAEGDTEGMVRASGTYSVDNDWTMSGWWKLGSITAANAILWNWGSVSGSDNMFLIHRDDHSGLTIQIGTVSGAKFLDLGVNIENDGSWHHIAVTRDHNVTDTLDRVTAYLDGSQVATGTRASIPMPGSGVTGTWAIANRDAVDLGITGSVAHVAFAQGVFINASQVSQQWNYRNF